MKRKILFLILLGVTQLIAADAPPNWAVAMKPTKAMVGQHELGWINPGSIVQVRQVAGNGWANVTGELAGKPLNGWVLANDIWVVGPFKPDAEWVFQKGLEFISAARLTAAMNYVAVAAVMSPNAIYQQTQRILQAITEVLKDRQEKLPRITAKIGRAALLEKEGAFAIKAGTMSGKPGASQQEGAEKIGQGRNLRNEAASDQRDLDNAFYIAMANVGEYVDSLGAAGAWDVAVALESLRAKYLGQVSKELLARAGAGAARLIATSTIDKATVGSVAQKIAFANGTLVDVYRFQQARSLASALAAVDKGLATFPYERRLKTLHDEIAPEVEKARTLMKQSAEVKESGDTAKAQQLRQDALKITADADQLLPPPAPSAPSTNAPPAATQTTPTPAKP